MKRLVQIVDAFLNIAGVLFLERRAHLLIFQRLFRLQAQLGALFHARLIGLRPVDDRHRVIRLGIVGVEFRGFAVKLLRLIKLLHLQVEIRNALHTVYVLGIALQHFLVLFDRALRHLVVIRSVGARNVLLGKGGGQIKPGVQ